MVCQRDIDTTDRLVPLRYIKIGADYALLRVYRIEEKKGYQILVTLKVKAEIVFTFRTSGNFTNKEHHALMTVWDFMNAIPRSYHNDRNLRKYHVGGNYYSIKMSELLKYNLRYERK